MHTVARTDRYNIYRVIHKAMRSLLCETLVLVGRLDTGDDAEMASTLQAVDGLLGASRSHLEHENVFLHTAIDAKLPGGAAQTAADHLGHLAAIEALERAVAALRAATPAAREPLAFALYHELALFVADNLEHMHVEETVNCAALWAHYSDAELHEIEGRLQASVAPPEMMELARWMVPAASPGERAEMLGGMRLHAPKPAFDAVMARVAPHVDAGGWAKLTRALAGAARAEDAVAA